MYILYRSSELHKICNRVLISTVKLVLSGHPRDPISCLLNRGVRLVQVHFTENKGRKIGKIAILSKFL